MAPIVTIPSPAYCGAHATRAEDAEHAADDGASEHGPRGVTLQKPRRASRRSAVGGETIP